MILVQDLRLIFDDDPAKGLILPNRLITFPRRGSFAEGKRLRLASLLLLETFVQYLITDLGRGSIVGGEWLALVGFLLRVISVEDLKPLLSMGKRLDLCWFPSAATLLPDALYYPLDEYNLLVFV